MMSNGTAYDDLRGSTICGMAEVGIDWSTAEVAVTGTDRGESLQLTVQLAPEPDTFWNNEFSRLRERRVVPVPRTDWWVDAPSFGKLTIGGVKPGSEAEIREVLDEMVAEANPAAEQARREWEEKRKANEKASSQRSKAAREMTERFRSLDG
jgi:hypothetical protein